MAAGAAAHAQGELSTLRTSLTVEEALLRSDVEDYRQARTAETSAAAAEEEAARELDAAIAASATPLSELERLELDLMAAQRVAEVTAERVADLRRRIFEGRRRAGALRHELARRTALAAGGDAVSGRWSVEIAAPPATGSFEMELTGTLVTGTYRMDDGSTGSLQGTYVAERLEVRRIDSVRGLDGVFEGTVDPVRGTVIGFWTPTILSGGSPGGAGWSGVRESTPGAEEPEEGVEGE